MNWLERIKAKRLGVRISNFKNISLGSRLTMEENSRLSDVRIKLPDSKQVLSIGTHSYVREGSEIEFLKNIGRYCSIGRNVVLGQAPNNHPIHWVSTSMAVSKNYQAESDYACIGNDVWIAHDAVIMAGVNIANGAVIGRNAVVTKDVSPYEIVVGNPGRVVRTRFTPEIIEALQASEWWNLDHAELGGLPFDDVQKFLERVATIGKKSSPTKLSIVNRRVQS